MPDYHAVASSCDFTNKNVVVVGGTQGIGAGIALRFAELGASVLIVGRNPSLGKDMLQSLRAKARNPTAKFEFVQKDLGSVVGIKEAAEEIAAWAGEDGVDYLYQTQGGISYFMPPKVDDVPIGFNVQVLSHFFIPYALLTLPRPILRKGSQICNIGRPGTTASVDLDDLSGIKAAKAGSLRKGTAAWIFMIDLFTQEFNVKFPETHTTHLYPGQVKTNGVNAPTLPWYIRYLGRAVLSLLGIPPAKYADIVIYQTASEEGRSLNRAFWDQHSKEVKVDGRVISDDDLRHKVWEGLLQLGEL